MPRRPIVSVGTPGRTLPMSADHHRVGGEQLGLRRRDTSLKRAADLLLALDHDLDPDRRLARPTRAARRCASRMFDFESAAPRPKIAPSRSVASNGGDSHFDSSPRARCRSAPYSSTVGRPSGAGISPDDDRRRVRQLERAELLDAGVPQQLDDSSCARAAPGASPPGSRARRPTGSRRGARARPSAAASTTPRPAVAEVSAAVEPSLGVAPMGSPPFGSPVHPQARRTARF